MVWESRIPMAVASVPPDGEALDYRQFILLTSRYFVSKFSDIIR